MLETGRTGVTRRQCWNIGFSLMLGLFVAFLDRINLSVALPQLSKDMGFAGDRFALTSSWALSIFLVGYSVANLAGGIATRHLDPKVIAIWSVIIWSVATVAIALTSSIAVLLGCRLMLGLAQGVYWPQQSRFAQAWFAPQELTRANSVIQYHGLYLALAIGFVVLTPIYDAFGWRFLFVLTGSSGLLIVAPLYAAILKLEAEAPHAAQPDQQSQPGLDLEVLGGPPFLLVVFSYVTQGMLFWGVTLWLPLAVQSLGFTGLRQACASALPYATAVLLAVPMSILADRTGKRVLIASLGMLVGGLLLLLLPFVNDNHAKLGLIILAVGYLASSYSPNIWSILQVTVKPQAVGPAVGIVNGLGAGGGGTIAGFLVGLLNGYTGSYLPGFMVLGGLVVLGSLALLLYGRLSARRLQPRSIALTA